MATEITKPVQGINPANGIKAPENGASLLEEYTPERVAEFLLNNAVGREGYLAARDEVRKLGIDPDTIPHETPRRRGPGQ